ncbi:hypothetical protein [Actinomadura roseirufa]|uniref:hypothetical protein n=1 Tax=Actinomadura roseirufa TaxID=2094049 RepID=UPI001041619B|nr:hypothetical protein [Actinomadura roseirufa]
MGQYNLPPETLAKIYYPRTVTNADGTVTTKEYGFTQAEWDRLPEQTQRNYYYEYSVGAGKPSDPANRLPRTNTPDGEWGFEAGKGYEVDPEELRRLAGQMNSKFTAWEAKLKKVSRVNITKASLGNIEGGEQFEELAGQTRDGFGTYLNDITAAYKGVIAKLTATADAYDVAHGKTVQAVNQANPGGNANFT